MSMNYRWCTQADAATNPHALDMFHSRNTQHTQQNKESRCGEKNSRQRRSYKRRKEERT